MRFVAAGLIALRQGSQSEESLQSGLQTLIVVKSAALGRTRPG